MRRRVQQFLCFLAVCLPGGMGVADEDVSASARSIFDTSTLDLIEELPESVALGLSEQANATTPDAGAGGMAFGGAGPSTLDTSDVEAKLGDGSTPEQQMWQVLHDFKAAMFEDTSTEELLSFFHKDFVSLQGSRGTFVREMTKPTTPAIHFMFDESATTSQGDLVRIAPVIMDRMDEAARRMEIAMTRDDQGEWKIIRLVPLSASLDTGYVDALAGDETSPEERVWATLREFKVTMYGPKTPERILAFFHDDFTSDSGSGERLAGQLAEIGHIPMLLLFDQAEARAKGDVWVVGPVVTTVDPTRKSPNEIELTLVQDDNGDWKILHANAVDKAASAEAAEAPEAFPDIYDPQGAYDPVFTPQY